MKKATQPARAGNITTEPKTIAPKRANAAANAEEILVCHDEDRPHHHGRTLLMAKNGSVFFKDTDGRTQRVSLARSVLVARELVGEGSCVDWYPEGSHKWLQRIAGAVAIQELS